jgi:hypothetical protein
MAKVRRINVSQVEGGNANDNNFDEIRPYGELGVYQGDGSKLELLMGDGVRTHLRTKVLSKGTFYGGDADSGDGLGLDTIKLVPDEELRRDGSDQYLIIDPTGPNHIHIRAGGPMDNSNAILILGGENNNVSVNDFDDKVIISTDTGLGTNNWAFSADGTTEFPENILHTNNNLTLKTSGRPLAVTAITYSSGSWDLNPNTGITTTGSSSGSGLTVDVTVDVSGYATAVTIVNPGNGYIAGDVITATSGAASVIFTISILPEKDWIFSADGNLTVPGIITKGDALQLVSTGITNDSSVNVYGDLGRVIVRTGNGTSNKDWEFDIDGELTLPKGSVVSETTTTTVITPPGAGAGQSLVIRPTAVGALTASGYIVPGQNLTITLENTSGTIDATGINYIITGATAQQLGIGSLTGTFPAFSPSGNALQYAEIVLPIPSNSTATTLTLTITAGTGFSGNSITVTDNGVLETSHIHLVAGNPATTDIYLGDDDQYVKIEKNGGNVVVGTNNNTQHWTFGTDGRFLLGELGVIYTDQTTGQVRIGDYIGPNGAPAMPSTVAYIGGDHAFVISRGNGSNNPTWTFGGDGSTVLPDDTLKGAGSLTVSTNYRAALGPFTGIVSQSMTASSYIIVSNINQDLLDGVTLSDLIGGTLTLIFAPGNPNQVNTILGVTAVGNPTGQPEYSVEITGPSTSLTGGTGVSISIAKAETKNDWTFGIDGRTTFPVASVPAHSYGVAGDKAGMLAFDATYIYYCTADYVDNSTDIWKRTAHGTGTW